MYFYDNSTLVYTFLPANYATLVGPCPGPFCGNPNPEFLGQDSGQQFAFLNFLDTSATFNKIEFRKIRRSVSSNPTTDRCRGS